MRLVRRRLRSRDAMLTLLGDVAPRYLGRPGGYTRMYKLGPRQGDGAPMVLLEFVEADMPQREGRRSEQPEKKTGILGRLRRKK